MNAAHFAMRANPWDAQDSKVRRWLAVIGGGMALLGILASLDLMVATVAAILSLGVVMLIAAGVQLAHAFRWRDGRGAGLWLSSGILYFLVGLVVLADPGFAAVMLTLALAFLLGLSGLLRCSVAWRWVGPGQGWMMTSGAISIFAALAIALAWPVNSGWVLGLFLAVDLLAQGVALLLIAAAPSLARS